MRVLKRRRLSEHAARIASRSPADQRLDREVPGGFERHYPARLQRILGMEAEAVAGKIENLGVDFARLAVHPDGELGVDAGIPGKHLLAHQNRFMFHVRSTSLGAY